MRKDLYEDLHQQERTHWWHVAKRKLIKALVEKYSPGKDLKVLDVGCGTGMVMKELSGIGEVWGVDSQDEAIKICKKKGIGKVLKAEAERLPFKSNSFNLLTALDVLEHTYDDKSLREFNRVLNPMGKLLITVPAYSWMWSKWDEILGHKRRYSQESISRVLGKNGFRIIKISYLYSFLLLPVYFIRKAKGAFSEEYSSDFLLSNRIINKILGFLASLERAYFLKCKIPFGLSLVVVAEKVK